MLIDGIRIGSATAGTVALQNLPLEQIERIEFVRGPRSSLYGSEAVGGVLQLFTRRGGGRLRPEFSVSGGSYGTLQGSAALQGGGERAWFSLQGSAQSVDGFDACRGSSTEFAGCFTEEPDDDASDYASVAVRGGYRFGADPGARKSRAVSGAPTARSTTTAASPTAVKSRSRSRACRWSTALRSGGKVTARAGRAWDMSDDFVDTTFTGDFETQRDTASLQVDLPVASAQVLTLGVDYQDDEVSGSTDYEVSSRNDVGLFAQYVASCWPLACGRQPARRRQRAVRRAPDRWAGSGIPVSPSWGLVAQYGTAFRAPTFNELYYPFFGNPDLEPEESQSAELAARGHAGSMRWRVSLFDTEISDLIGFDANFAPANIDEARILGMEAGITLDVDGWTIDAGLTLLDPENRSAGPERGKSAPAPARGHGKAGRRTPLPEIHAGCAPGQRRLKL